MAAGTLPYLDAVNVHPVIAADSVVLELTEGPRYVTLDDEQK